MGLRSTGFFSSDGREQEKASAIRTMAKGRNTFRSWSLVWCRPDKLELNGRRRFKLLTEIGFFNSRIIGQVLRWTFHNYSSGFQNVSAIGMPEGCVRVLFDEENCSSLAFNFIDSLEDRVDNERRKTERRLVEQEQSRIRHQRAPHCKHLLFTA